MATDDMKALKKARTVGVDGSRFVKVAPVTMMPSPSAMMMNRAQRSAIWAPLMVQSAAVDRPSPGTKKKVDGPEYSMASAASHHNSRRLGSLSSPPAIQKQAATAK